jgi:hypothetical protein
MVSMAAHGRVASIAFDPLDPMEELRWSYPSPEFNLFAQLSFQRSVGDVFELRHFFQSLVFVDSLAFFRVAAQLFTHKYP